MDGNLKKMAVLLIANILMKLDDDEIGDDECTNLLLDLVENKLHEVYASGIEAGRKGS